MYCCGRTCHPVVHYPHGWDELLPFITPFLHCVIYWITIVLVSTASHWILSFSSSFALLAFYKCRRVLLCGLLLAYPCLQYVRGCLRNLFPLGTLFTNWVSLESLRSVSISLHWKHHPSKVCSRSQCLHHVVAQVLLSLPFHGTVVFYVPPGWKVSDFKAHIFFHYHIPIIYQ
jgi:hypothetical protein